MIPHCRIPVFYFLLLVFPAVAQQQPAKRHVRICHFGQGAGILFDANILQREFEIAGFYVSRVSVRAANQSGIAMHKQHRDILAVPADINLFLEVSIPVWALAIGHATAWAGQQNWLMVNQDFSSGMVSMYHLFDVTLCKTRSAEQAITRFFLEHQIKSQIKFIGFTSTLQGSDRSSSNFNQVLHVAGKSWSKGTEAVLSCWLAHPDFPKITIVCTCPEVPVLARFCAVGAACTFMLLTHSALMHSSAPN
jgi:hypothetical protein